MMMMTLITNAPAPVLPAALQPKDMNSTPIMGSIDGQEPAPVTSMAWQTSAILTNLWEVPKPFIEKFGYEKTAMAWIQNHPTIAQSWEKILDYFNVPCPAQSPEMGGLISACIAVFGWGMGLYTAIKQDSQKEVKNESITPQRFTDISRFNHGGVTPNEQNTKDSAQPNTTGTN